MGSMKCPVIYLSPIDVVWCGVFVCLCWFLNEVLVFIYDAFRRGEDCVCDYRRVMST
jgi:hypothetical protein